jgi:hypothetical protein
MDGVHNRRPYCTSADWCTAVDSRPANTYVWSNQQWFFIVKVGGDHHHDGCVQLLLYWLQGGCIDAARMASNAEG